MIGALNEFAGGRGTWSCRRPAACPATCSGCGGPATRRSTTSSTATRAWATRSPAALGAKLADPEPRGVRAGRRRVLPDDGAGDRHRRRRAHQARHRHRRRTTASPRSARSRSRVGSQRFGTSYRYREPADRAARRRSAARRPGRQRGQPGRRRAAGPDRRRNSGTASSGPGRRPVPPWCTSRPIRSRRPRPPRAGGTCRWHRPPRWTAPEGARRLPGRQGWPAPYL